MATNDRAFAALLKYWRGQRGLSQFDLGLIADVSARHISFLETGRSRPSLNMVLLLAETLDVPLRNRNELLRAAGFEARYPEPSIEETVDSQLSAVLEAMMKHHAPFPLVVFDRTYNLICVNDAGEKLLAATLEPTDETNLLRLLFSAAGRAAVDNWEGLASILLRRLQRELLYAANDEAISELLTELLALPDVPADWRQPRLSELDDHLLPIVLRLGDVHLSFLMALTVFDSPQNVTLSELRIESWFPLDEQTSTYCEEHQRCG